MNNLPKWHVLEDENILYRSIPTCSVYYTKKISTSTLLEISQVQQYLKIVFMYRLELNMQN